jgi:hypothetical protein
MGSFFSPDARSQAIRVDVQKLDDAEFSVLFLASIITAAF